MALSKTMKLIKLRRQLQAAEAQGQEAKAAEIRRKIAELEGKKTAKKDTLLTKKGEA